MAGSNWERVYKMAFANVYPQYVRKAEAKGRSQKPQWDGPDEQTLKEIINISESKTQKIDDLRKLGDWDITALVTWIKVFVREEPLSSSAAQTWMLE